MQFGPHFEQELRAAGLLGLPFTWGAQGIEFSAGITPDQRDAVLAVAAAHNPAPYPTFQGHQVFSAADVDRVTSRRILGYLAPQWAGDERMQERHLLRALQDFARAQEIKRDPASFSQADIEWADQAIIQARQKDAQVLLYRQEAADFKAANNLT